MKSLRLGALALTALLSVWSCAALTPPVVASSVTASCRAAGATATVHWFTPDDERNRARLDGACAAVGPVLFESVATDAADWAGRPALQQIAFVSWNVHVGAGDVRRLVADLEAGRLTGGRPPAHVVLMLQEAVRTEGVPADVPAGAYVARRLGSAGVGDGREIEAVARDLGLSVFYAPSIRNGAVSPPRHPATDRGNAILSTLPLSAPVAIELPGHRQRRVAVTAEIPARAGDRPVDLGIGSAHLDTMGPPRTLWLLGAAALRREQARTLVDVLPVETPFVLGADLNTWMGPAEPAAEAIGRLFPDTPRGRRVGTFIGGLVLDHLFFRSPDGWRARFERVPDRYGSDHHPLVGWLEF